VGWRRARRTPAAEAQDHDVHASANALRGLAADNELVATMGGEDVVDVVFRRAGPDLFAAISVLYC